MHAKNITAEEYFAAEERARRSGADKPRFREMLAQLKALPEVQERLAFGCLAIILELVQNRTDPGLATAAALRWIAAVPAKRRGEYVDILERTILASFVAMGAARKLPQKYPPFYLPLNDSLLVLRKLDESRCRAMVRQLLGRLDTSGGDIRYGVLQSFER